MQSLLSASKAWQTIPAGSLKKREQSIKHTKNKLSLLTEIDDPEISSLVKTRKQNNFKVKFQNLAIKIYKSYKNFSIMLFSSCEI